MVATKWLEECEVQPKAHQAKTRCIKSKVIQKIQAIEQINLINFTKGKFLNIQTSKIWRWTINKVLLVSISILHYYKSGLVNPTTFQK